MLAGFVIGGSIVLNLSLLFYSWTLLAQIEALEAIVFGGESEEDYEDEYEDDED